MKRTNLIARATIVLIAAGCADFPADTHERLTAEITYLAADEREGRGVGTDGLAQASEYLADAFRRIGLEAPDGSYLQRFVIDSTAPAAAHAGLGGEAVTNVVGILPGSGSLAEEVVVIGAHYDHLGLGGEGSLEPDRTGDVHNGADDNASGTVALLEIARILRTRETEDARTLVFVAFTAEELGLIGSTHYVSNPVRSNDATYAMVNLDMVGRLTEDRLAAFGAETAVEFPDLLDSVRVGHQLDVAPSGDGFGRSDHQSFFVEGIPVLHFFTGTHEDYHATTDDAERINIDGLARVATYVADVTWAIAIRTDSLTFVDAEPRTVTASEGERPYLGTVPDMTSSPGGVRVSGVTAGSPADDAGMRAGDILTAIGEHTVADLYDMTNALNAHQPGDTVILVIRRDGTTIELTATLGRRSE